MQGFTTTTHRVVNRRGVMWLGQTCNLRCYFCYFLDKIETKADPEHAFMSLEKAKAMCKTLVDYYGCNSVDIQGGEPTVWGKIYELIAYCNEIGLKPTLITNGLQLAKPEVCEKLVAAGVYDLLISVHGLRNTYDKIVMVDGASERQLKGLENVQKYGIPFRLNCVLSKPVIQQLPRVTELAFQTGARVVNFIAFNPFVDQSTGKRSADTVPTYSEVMTVLTPLLDEFDRRGVECNVRYLPFCVFEERHRKFCQNFQQIVYDLHEWDAASEAWTTLPEQRQAARELSPPIPLIETVWRRRLMLLDRSLAEQIEAIPFARARDLARRSKDRLSRASHKLLTRTSDSPAPAPSNDAGTAHAAVPLLGNAAERVYKVVREHVLHDTPLPETEALNREARRLMSLASHPYTRCEACTRCDLAGICDGFHGDYGGLFSFDEAKPIQLGRKITDPKHYIQHQLKVVEEQEFGWALPESALPRAAE